MMLDTTPCNVQPLLKRSRSLGNGKVLVWVDTRPTQEKDHAYIHFTFALSSMSQGMTSFRAGKQKKANNEEVCSSRLDSRYRCLYR